MIRKLYARSLEAFARWLGGLSASLDAEGARQWRLWHGRECERAAKAVQRREIERLIAESRTPGDRVGAPIHRDR